MSFFLVTSQQEARLVELKDSPAIFKKIISLSWGSLLGLAKNATKNEAGELEFFWWLLELQDS